MMTPKIELSNERQERVDLRVLPVIFRFERPKDMPLYPRATGGRLCQR